MIKATLNCCKDLWKSAWVRRVLYNQQDNETYDQIADENHDCVRALVMNLPDKYRVIVHLYYYEEFNIKEISVILNMNINTVHTRLKRAREILKKALVNGGYNYEI